MLQTEGQYTVWTKWSGFFNCSTWSVIMRNDTVFSLNLKILLTSICNNHFKEHCHSFPKSYWLGSSLIFFFFFQFTQRDVYWMMTLATFSCFFVCLFLKEHCLFNFNVDWGDFEGPCQWVCQSVKIQQIWMDSLHYLIV